MVKQWHHKTVGGNVKIQFVFKENAFTCSKKCLLSIYYMPGTIFRTPDKSLGHYNCAV